jgi:hypothetical protein
MSLHKNEPVPGQGPRVMPVATPSGPAALQVTQDATQVAGILFATAARTELANPDGLGAGVYASSEQQNAGAKGVRLFTVVADGSGTVVVKIQVRDPNTDVWVDLAGAATAALDNNPGALLTVYPGLTGIADAAGVTCNQHLGPAWRVVATVATASETFSVGADYLI